LAGSGGGGGAGAGSSVAALAYGGGGGGGGGGGLPLASEVEAMRAALRIRNGEVHTLEATVRALELTRDRCGCVWPL
jgi:hypothetical protein